MHRSLPHGAVLPDLILRRQAAIGKAFFPRIPFRPPFADTQKATRQRRNIRLCLIALRLQNTEKGRSYALLTCLLACFIVASLGMPVNPFRNFLHFILCLPVTIQPFLDKSGIAGEKFQMGNGKLS